MNTNKLKSYAPQARRDFIQAVSDQAALYGFSADRTEPMTEQGEVAIIAGRPFTKVVAAKRKKLEARIKQQGYEQTMEAIAYTWFNRLVAIRYMELHQYLEHGYRVLSHPEEHHLPEIVEHAEHVELPKLDKQKVIELKLDGTQEEELYRTLLLAQCNALNRVMPFMFETIDDETELLLPDNLLHSDSLIRKLCSVLTAEQCEDVEVIGWLYQFYIAEKKDDVFAALKKGKKITPANIPAATQLFTPHWIVRYLVENSLGRLWMLNHPESKLFQNMKDRGDDCYYIEPVEPETDFLKISSPEEIKICDPACGSGHMLTYAFDLLYAIYEEQGYRATDIPRLILENNLYGIEIDQRAGALAAFALTMKAREKYPRFLSADKVVQPNICVLENIHFDPDDLSAYMDKVGRDLFSGGLQGVLNQWEEADNFGSLIRPLVTDVSEVLALLCERKMGVDLFLADIHQKVLKALKQADYLSPKYHVVVANPPYMGSSGMGPSLKEYIGKEYKAYKADLFAAFMIRTTTISHDKAEIGFVTPFNWMYLSSFEDLREDLLHAASITSLVQLEYNAFEPAMVSVCAATLSKAATNIAGTYIQLANFKGHQNQAPRTLEAIRDSNCNWRYIRYNEDFEKIPGNPISFEASHAMREAFASLPNVFECAETRIGLITGDNDRYIRFWHEVGRSKIGLSLSREDANNSEYTWFPQSKGGDFRKWYGNNDTVLDWSNDGHELQTRMHSSGKRTLAHNFNLDKVFHAGITWTKLSASKFGIRFQPKGFLFNDASANAFARAEKNLLPLLGLLGSKVAREFLNLLNPTLNFLPGNVSDIPVPTAYLTDDEATARVHSIVENAKQDWDSSERSWEFQCNPVVSISQATLGESYTQLREVNTRQVSEQMRLESENNRHLMKLFEVTDEFSELPTNDEITLFCNPHYRYGSGKSDSELEALLLADTMREFISYAVGCMFGRYSLDKPGLILANQGDTAENYRQQVPEPTFAPDEDGIIPLLDDNWFDDDITPRFHEFLRVTFGEEHFEENLAFLEKAIGKDVRKYMTTEFFKHHLKMYKKRPIYWLFSSGKQKGFQAVVYLHRYNAGTLARMRTEYVIPLLGKITARINQLSDDIASTTSSQQTKRLEKEKTKLTKQLTEIQTYDEKLRHYADQRIELDLDDGVKVNYTKFGDLLAEVKAVTGKKPE